MLVFKLISVFLFILRVYGIENGELGMCTMVVYDRNAYIDRGFLAASFCNA